MALPMSLPKVTCVCPTFARAHLLEEAVESFLRQDYLGELELVICNDFPVQHFTIDHPRIVVANHQERMASLGEKRHRSCLMASGEYLLTWGDDDVHLPSRVSRMVEFVLANGGQFALEGPHYCLYGNKMVKNMHATVGAHIISTDLYHACGGIPHENRAEDVSFNDRVHARIGRLPCCPHEPQFIYRWNSGRPHVSAVAASAQHRHRAWERMEELAIELVDKGHEPQGVINLNPHWKVDWVGLTQL